MTASPQLLVSVRDAREAESACRGGADIIDIKEPDHGPLGFAGGEAISAVTAVVGTQRPVSAALGECGDWLDGSHPTPLTADTCGRLAFVKLGLAELSEHDDWRSRWKRARTAALEGGMADQSGQLCPSGESDPLNQNDARRPAWVAVAYADYVRAGSPPPTEILTAAREAGCTALLLDTYVKDGRTTVDWLEEDGLQQLREAASAAGLSFALAGQISVGHTPVIRDLRPDIVAVRGAVCDGSDRRQAVSAERVRALKDVLRDVLVDVASHPVRCPHV